MDQKGHRQIQEITQGNVAPYPSNDEDIRYIEVEPSRDETVDILNRLGRAGLMAQEGREKESGIPQLRFLGSEVITINEGYTITTRKLLFEDLNAQ